MTTTEDRLDIHDLEARVSQSIDAGDLRGWLECLTEDAVIERAAGPIKGHVALTEFFQTTMTRPPFRHFTGNVRIDATQDPNTATARSYVLYYYVKDTGIELRATAIHEDELVKSNGRWRIRWRRTIGPFGMNDP